jgi:oligosaccharide reducing-end xylanase
MKITKNHSLKIGYRNVIGHLVVFATVTLLALPAKAQYEVATWSKFKAAAVTYTFDDNTASQLTIALPLFDQYNYKVTFFPVPAWGPNWSGFQTAANNGHEIGSHTYNHVDISGMKVADLETELTQSVNTVNTNITGSKCITIAYPFCNAGDKATLEKYFIAARVCSNGVESKNLLTLWLLMPLPQVRKDLLKLQTISMQRCRMPKIQTVGVYF